MSGEQFVLRSRRVLTPGGLREAAVVVRDGKVAAVVPEAEVPAGLPVTDVGDKVVMPGVVDSHAHINEPGRTEWEGFETATRAAAAGGITTLVDMPLNSLPPTTTLEALRLKQEAARGAVTIDVAFWGGAIPGNEDELAPLAAAGVCGFKAFTIDSGVPEFPPLDREQLAQALATCASVGATLIIHAEAAGPIAAAPAHVGRSYASWLASRPQAAEVEAISLLVELMKGVPDARVHVVHLSAADALPVIAEAQADGLALSAETCPHYLALAAEDIADGATLCKCAPPI